MAEKNSGAEGSCQISSSRPESIDPGGSDASDDVFGREEGHDIKYKTLGWPMVAAMMTTEIVSGAIASLPSALAVVGMVPGLIVIVFLGIFATYTSWQLVRFKHRHPQVHTMGDAGFILFGPIGRDALAIGTIVFAVCATGAQFLLGQTAISALSNNRICPLLGSGIIALFTFAASFQRTLDHLGWISAAGCLSILVAGIIAMIGAGANPVPNRIVHAFESPSFYTSFISITNPVNAYAGHFMFFVLISEMHRPQDAMKAAYTLQGFATTFYTVFAAVSYSFLGSKVASPSFGSLTPRWQKAAYGAGLLNFWIAGSLYVHTASKLCFVRMFRNSRHLHSHTGVGWASWAFLVLVFNGAAFVLAVGIPIFNLLLGLLASLFAAWFTYGLAGMFWLHDTYHDEEGFASWRQKWFQAMLAVLTILAGAFICVAGLYVTIRAIIDAYSTGQVATPFVC